MTYKIYCDVCETPIKDHPDRVRRILGKVMIEIMVRYENTWNAGHICDACVIRVINEGRAAKEDESWIDDQLRERRKTVAA